MMIKPGRSFLYACAAAMEWSCRSSSALPYRRSLEYPQSLLLSDWRGISSPVMQFRRALRLNRPLATPPTIRISEMR
jgi:hypothetical protein